MSDYLPPIARALRELATLREENAQLTADVDNMVLVAQKWEEEYYKVRAHVAALVQAVRRFHEECSYLKVDKKYLNLGPMMEPSEAAVLEARALLDAPDLAALVREAQAMESVIEWARAVAEGRSSPMSLVPELRALDAARAATTKKENCE